MTSIATRLYDVLRLRLGTRRRDDEGATAVEYGLMVALIAGVIIVAVTALGGQVNKGFEKTCGAIQNTTVAAPASTAPEKCS